MADMKAILDTIRANASLEYQNRVPTAVQNSLTAVGNPIITYQAIQNEFLSALVNRIALTVVQSKTAKNPLAVLKKGTVPLGSDIQEIFTNMAKDTGYDPTGAGLLNRTLPDTKALYHRFNRQSQYPVTITKSQLQMAFTDYGKLEAFMSSIITSMYSGDTYDEFVLMKNMFASAITGANIVTCNVPHVKDEASGKAFIKAVKNACSGFTFPSSSFNKYFEKRPSSDNGAPVMTWTPTEDQVLVVRADVMNEIDVDVLAAAFNMDKVTFLANTLKVDSFGGAVNCLAVLIDRSWVQVYDNLFETTEFYNPKGMYWNYYLNHWQTYSYSLFANAVAFICGDEAISLNKTTMSFTTTATQSATATVTPNDATVDWITSDARVATVVGGVVTPHANGTCTISAVNGDSVANIAVTVNIP